MAANTVIEEWLSELGGATANDVHSAMGIGALVTLAERLAAIRADDPDEQHWARLELDLERDEHEQWRQSQDWADLLESMPPRDAEPAQASSCTTTGA